MSPIVARQGRNVNICETAPSFAKSVNQGGVSPPHRAMRRIHPGASARNPIQFFTHMGVRSLPLRFGRAAGYPRGNTRGAAWLARCYLPRGNWGRRDTICTWHVLLTDPVPPSRGSRWGRPMRRRRSPRGTLPYAPSPRERRSRCAKALSSSNLREEPYASVGWESPIKPSGTRSATPDTSELRVYPIGPKRNAQIVKYCLICGGHGLISLAALRVEYAAYMRSDASPP